MNYIEADKLIRYYKRKNALIKLFFDKEKLTFEEKMLAGEEIVRYLLVLLFLLMIVLAGIGLFFLNPVLTVCAILAVGIFSKLGL